jgi:endonuclease/exonuclease/phosphatase family metal-dependent hydrolase
MFPRRLTIGLLTLLLPPALLLTYARLAERSGGFWVRLVAFTPYAAGLYALALLVLLLARWRAGGRLQSAATALAVASASGLVLHLAWVSGAYVGPAGASAKEGGTFRMMTADLMRGGADTSRLLATALDRRVDVLVLEGVTPPALRRMRAAGLAKAYPHAAGRAADGPAGTMVFARGRINGVRRIGTAFESYAMRVRVAGGSVHLVAVHPRPPRGDAGDWASDLNAVRTAAVAQDGPTVVAGDFNATLDHLPMRDLRGRGFEDAATSARSRWQPTWPAAGQVHVLGVALPSLVALDHVLVNRGLNAVHTESVEISGTDHRALVAILSR